jgi:hypothetical protein
MAKRKKLTEKEMLTAVQQEINDAEGYDGGTLSRVREDALMYYFVEPEAAPSMPGRSKVQSSDVADMVEAVTAQIMPAFSMESLVEFQAVDDDDVEQAQQETEAVEDVIMSKNNGMYEIESAIKDALIMRNGFIKVFLDERVDTDTKRYERLTVLQYGELARKAVADVEQVDNGIEITEHEEESGFHSVTVKTKKTERKIRVKAIDPLNCSWSESWDSVYLDQCPFFCEYSLVTRSELLQMGYNKTKVMAVPTGGQGHTSRQARNPNRPSENLQGAEPSQDLIDFWETYIRIDKDNDGIAELRKVCVAGQTILEDIEVDYTPYATGTPFMVSHRLSGLGLFDKLCNTQDAKTSVIRQWLDNQNHANNSRTGLVRDMVDMDSFTNSRPGGGVIIESPDALVPFPFTDVGPSAAAALDYMDKQRSEQGGASLDLQAAEMQVAGQTAHGVERQMSSKEMLAAQMTRTLANTLIRTVYGMVHKAMRLYIPDEIKFRRGGRTVTVNPGEWREREEITVKAGLTLAERQQRQQRLQTVIARQDYLYSNGGDGTLVSEEQIYTATVDWCRAGGIDNAERYFMDPRSPESQQAAQQKAQQAQEQQAYQQRLLALQQQIEDRKANNEDAKVFEDARQFDRDLQFRYWKEGSENELKEAEIATKTALELVSGRQESERGDTAEPESAA